MQFQYRKFVMACGCFELGMAGNRRSSTLDRAEPTEKQWVGAVLLFKREESALESLLDRAIFSHRRPPFCRIAGLSQ